MFRLVGEGNAVYLVEFIGVPAYAPHIGGGTAKHILFIFINQDKEKFNIGAKKVPCRIRIEAIDGFTYTYKLFVKEKGMCLKIRDSQKVQMV